LAEAEFGRIWEKWPNFGFAEAEIWCNPNCNVYCYNMLVPQIVMPAVFICLAMTFSKIHPPVAQMPAMEIHPWLLTQPKMKDSHLYVFYRSAFLSVAVSQSV